MAVPHHCRYWIILNTYLCTKSWHFTLVLHHICNFHWPQLQFVHRTGRELRACLGGGRGAMALISEK